MSNYIASDIKVLKGLDAVRKRPGMYIGSVDETGLHQLVWEIIDNAIDEVLAGFAKTICVTLLKNNGIEISDDGRGIPIDYHSASRKSGVELVFTELHAGGKFGGSSSAYKISGGLNGVGASVVNAFSKKMIVLVGRDNLMYLTEFSDGGKILTKTNQVEIPYEKGTKIIFYPQFDIFSISKFNPELIIDKLQELAFLNPNLKIIFKSELGHKMKTFQYTEGLKEFVSYINEGKQTYGEPIIFSGELNNVSAEVAFQYNDGYVENIISFVNNIKTKNGGAHETGFKTAWTKVINEYAKKQNLTKRGIAFEGADVREGLTAIISAKIPENILGFVGQTKDTLRSIEAKSALDNIISQNLSKWLDANKNLSFEIINKILSASRARLAARKARQDVRILKNTLSGDLKILSGKLTPAQSKDAKVIELFLVEGESAGGSAKLGRNKKIQAILPLKGKVLNTEKSRLIDVLKNAEILSIIAAVGGGVGEKFNLKTVKYDKLIIMTDADTDGAHIQVLILTFLFRYMRPLFEAGKIYVARPPLYKVTTTKTSIYLWEDKELEDYTSGLKNYSIQRYKGLGEMNASQLWETTMDPKKRTLYRISIRDVAAAEKRISVLMGDKPHLRKEWINQNVQFTSEDGFDKK